MERDQKDAFVIWLDGDPDDPTQSPPERPLRGRVEHVQSADRAPFQNEEELVRFLARHRRPSS
ncbi:MAG: hypothetical protein QNK03_06540 [Myxococcota bacterium]|nr:hypothetical protein [Myxococcota bacterium]